MVYVTDGERSEWSGSGGTLSLLWTRGTMACLIISALSCSNSGCVGWAELPCPSLAPFQSKDHLHPLFIWGEKRMGLKVLRHPIRAETAAFSSFVSLFIIGAVGEGLSSALLLNKMAKWRTICFQLQTQYPLSEVQGTGRRLDWRWGQIRKLLGCSELHLHLDPHYLHLKSFLLNTINTTSTSESSKIADR